MVENQIINDSREMALTRKDFFRILPRAVGENTYSIDADGATVNVAGGVGAISLGPQQVRKIALMEVPWCRVDFQAKGLTDTQFEEFSEHFHRRFQRGGG